MNSILIFVVGILSIFAGVFAFFDPFSATVAAEQLTAWLFLFVGFMEIFSAMRVKHIKSLFWTLILSAIVALLIGFFLLLRPVQGILSLTVVIGILFLVSGLVKLGYSFMFRKEKYFWANIFSGLISLALSALIFGNFPDSAASILGILLSIELLFSGMSLVMVSIFFRKQEKIATK